MPVRLAVTDETESLDWAGIELTVGTISGNLELTACVERILRAHLETLAMPAHVSGATFFSYFHVSKP